MRSTYSPFPVSLYITTDCINCGACEEICPTEAICEDKENSIRMINFERCTECVGFYERAMCQVECPVECCQLFPHKKETTSQLLEKAKKLIPNQELLPPNHFHTK